MKKLEIEQIIKLGDAIDKLKIVLDEVTDKYSQLESILEKDYIEETFKRR